MIKSLWNILKSIVGLADDLQRYHSEVADLRDDLTELAAVVREMKRDLAHLDKRVDGEREKLLLEIENRLLKAERALPPAPSKKRGKK